MKIELTASQATTLFNRVAAGTFITVGSVENTYALYVADASGLHIRKIASAGGTPQQLIHISGDYALAEFMTLFPASILFQVDDLVDG